MRSWQAVVIHRSVHLTAFLLWNANVFLNFTKLNTKFIRRVGDLLMWHVVNVACCECGILWMWLVVNVACECGLHVVNVGGMLWMWVACWECCMLCMWVACCECGWHIVNVGRGAARIFIRGGLKLWKQKALKKKRCLRLQYPKKAHILRINNWLYSPQTLGSVQLNCRLVFSMFFLSTSQSK